MTKVAKLVTVTFITRVIVDENASDEQIFEAARPTLKQKAAEEMFENLESIVDDTECPYNPETDQKDGYWQPEFDENGYIKGHDREEMWSFEVYRSKERLMQDFPNCTPVKYSEGDIEDPVFKD
jgi:hypothetical protein